MKSPGTASAKTSGKKAKASGKPPGKFPTKGQLRREYKGEARREDASAHREEIDARHREAEAQHYRQEAAKAEREGYKKEAEYDLAKAAREQAEARRDMARARHNEAKARRSRHKAARVGLALPGAISGGWILGGNGWHQGCAAVALANHLYASTGLAVSAQDVLGLYRLTADDPAQGASIQATLEAAAEYGLGGMRPGRFGPADIHELQAADRHGAARPETKHGRELEALQFGQFDRLDDVAVALLDDDAPVAAGPVNGDHGDVGRRDPPLVLVHPLIVDLRLQRAQRHQPVWDWEPSPDWGPHAGLLASDRVITWGREIPVTEDFLARHVVGAWRVEWARPQAAAQGRAPCHATPGPALPRPA